MNVKQATLPEWPVALRHYLVFSLVLHLAWEVLQLPLYTIWSEPFAKQAFAIIHCTVGDLMIAELSLVAALALVGRRDWPSSGGRAVWLLLIMFGAGYTVYGEWLNVRVRRTWAYGPLMPTLPVFGTGVSPLLQWIVVPTFALRLSIGRWPTP